jgi:hypothetical protein
MCTDRPEQAQQTQADVNMSPTTIAVPNAWIVSAAANQMTTQKTTTQSIEHVHSP